MFQDSGSGQGQKQAYPDRLPGLVTRVTLLHRDKFEFKFVFLDFLVSFKPMAHLQPHPRPRRVRFFSGEASEEAEETGNDGGRWFEPAASAVQPLRSSEDSAVENRAEWSQDTV